jgi:hypothetical protein
MVPQLFRQDDEPKGELGLALRGPAILTSRRSAAGYRRPQPTPTAESPIEAEAVDEPTSAAVPVILSLPDLREAAIVESSRGIDLPNILSWTAIVLGALIAVTLIWTAPKAAPPDADVAPAWDAPVERRSNDSDSPATPWQSPQAPAESDQAPPASSEKPGTSTTRPLGLAADELPRTARAPQLPGQPTESDALGEIAPVGRITNVAVPQ